MAGDPNSDSEITGPEPPAAGVKDSSEGPKSKAQTTAAGRAARGGEWLSWIVLFLLIIVSGAQALSVLLRDRVEGRTPTLTRAPPEPKQPRGSFAAGDTARGSRFGSGVTEVVVATSPSEKSRRSVQGSGGAPSVALAPPAVPESPVKPVPPADSGSIPQPLPEPEPSLLPASDSEASSPPPEPAVAVAETTAKPNLTPQQTSPSKPARAGDYVLQVGVFRSQRYRREQERKLDQLEVPHLRDEFTREGEGYRLAIPVRDESDRIKTRQVLEGAGYAFWETSDGIEAHFFLEAEAQVALDTVAKHGLKGGYGHNEGLIPLWTVYAGPFSKSEARSLQQRLAGAGVDTLLKKRR